MKRIAIIALLIVCGCMKADTDIETEIEVPITADFDATALIGVGNRNIEKNVTTTEETMITTTQGAGSTNNDTSLMKKIIDAQAEENKKLQNIIAIMFVLIMVTNFVMFVMLQTANRGRRKDKDISFNKLLDDVIKGRE